MLPDEFTQIKKKIETSSILSDTERKEWLFLLPKMKPEQIKELDRILSIRMPPSAKASGGFQPESTPSSSPPYQGGERVGVDKKEGLVSSIRHSIFNIRHSKIPTPPKHIPHNSGVPSLKVREGEGELFSISSLSIDNMRSFPSVFTFLEEVASDMKRLKQGGKRAEDIILAFEESPLYRAYLKAGLNLLDQAEKTESIVSRQEFEAIAEFRADLRKILNSNI